MLWYRGSAYLKKLQAAKKGRQRHERTLRAWGWERPSEGDGELEGDGGGQGGVAGRDRGICGMADHQPLRGVRARTQGWVVTSKGDNYIFFILDCEALLTMEGSSRSSDEPGSFVGQPWPGRGSFFMTKPAEQK